MATKVESDGDVYSVFEGTEGDWKWVADFASLEDAEEWASEKDERNKCNIKPTS